MDRAASRTGMPMEAMVTKQTAAPPAADHAKVVDLVGTSGDEDEAQGMNTQRPSRTNVKREHAVGSVVYDVDTNETDHSQDNNRSNGVDRDSVESLISTFVNAREMMEKKLKQLQQEWKACHERYKYACARGFYANDRDGREDRAIDNMRRIETDIDNLKAQLQHSQPGRHVAAAAVTPVAQRNDELAEEGEIGSSDKDRDDGSHNGSPQDNNTNDGTQESSTKDPFHPLGTKPKAKSNMRNELDSVESDEEVEDDSSNEESDSDGNSFQDETPQKTSESLHRTRYPIRNRSEKVLQVYEGVDLTGVPKLPPIKSKIHGASSKYQGVSFRNGENKWEAKISINGWKHTIGCYDDEREAAVDYARAFFKYRGGNKSSIEAMAAGKSMAKNKRAEDRVPAKRPSLQMNEASAKSGREALDLTDVPYQRPILRDDTSGTSRYVGVSSYNKGGKFWIAKIRIRGKPHTIGYYYNEREAAVDYARALFKYRGGNKSTSDTKAGKTSAQKYASKRRALPLEDGTSKKKPRKNVLDLSDVPYQRPILRDDTSGTSRYVGVTLHKGINWRAQIGIDGKQHTIGFYDNEKEAAVDYARAVFKYRGGNEQSSNTKTAGNSMAKNRRAEGRVPAKRLSLQMNETSGQRKKKPQKEKEGKFVDLSDVPYQRPILRDDLSGTSRYVGVSLNNKGKNGFRWRAQFSIDGKRRTIGYYNNEREAAVDYARAVFKYGGVNESNSDTKAGKSTAQECASMKRCALPLEDGTSKKKPRKNVLDLSDVPYQRPIPRCDGRACSSKYQGVTYEKKYKKWRVTIDIDGRKYFLGYHDDETEAAVVYARAVYKYVEQSWI